VASPFPILRWLALAWLILWVPVYSHYWGLETFLQLCDTALVLGCLGLFSGNALLISSQAVATPIIGLVWAFDVAWRFFLDRHLIGGTEYMWDARFPIWARLPSFFHVVLPIVLIWALRRVGYHRRAWLAQSGVFALLLLASRFIKPERNMNYAVRDALFHRSLGPAPLHLMIIFAVTVLLLFGPAHLAFLRAFPPPSKSKSF
jgi:hypothetical protein